MVFENIILDGGLRYPVPKYPNSYIEVSPHLQSGGTMMSVSISLDDVFNGDLPRLDPQALPGGRPSQVFLQDHSRRAPSQLRNFMEWASTLVSRSLVFLCL